MPVTSPQGTLDFKKVDKITFVGASSNTVIDTTTGSVGIGVVGDALSSNLHVVGDTRMEGNINMLHTSNTASIKLNSNVVTEFPRSKKLIKYPRVALTQNDESGTSGYVVEQTNTASHGNADAYAYRLFDNTSGAYQSGSAYSGGIPTSSAPTTTASDGSTHQGVAITLDLVTKIRLDHVIFTSHANYGRTPVDGTFLGSNNSSTWDVIQTFSGLSTSGDNQKHTINITNSSQKLAYRYIRFVITKTHTSSVFNGGGLLEFRELEYYGIPEYDPDAAGLDVKVTSYPNVPNTDWLEVYYDAKNYTSGVVQDLSTNSFDGTLTNGASFNNSDGIDKFVFDGSNDYISGSIPSTFTGNQTYTFSIWVKPDSHPSGFVGVFEVGTRSDDDAMGLYFDTGKIVHLAYANNLATTTVATIGQWVHITGTYTSGDRRVYANGNLLKQDDYSGLTLAGTTFKLGSNLGGTQPFDGSIANFRLFNRALTSDEIYQLYAYQKEYFGHGNLSMTLKAGRLGIGTSEPKAALDVRGGIAGPFTTFLTGDVTTSIITSAPSTSTIYPVTSYTFDVPSEYHAYGTKNLEIYGQIKWCGEIDNPWNAMFSARVYYGSGLTSYVDSAENTSSNAGTRNNGAGVPSTNTTNDDYISTLEACILSSRFYIPNCPVSNGSQLKLELRFRQGNAASSLYTNRTVNDLTNDVNYERGTTNFFLAVK